MIYDYKSDETVQDVILECFCPLIEDIVDEYSTLRRYENLIIYAPSYIAREIVGRILEEVDDLWVNADSENELLYKDYNEVIITIARDGMIFIESARGENGQLKDNGDCSLTYVYDGFEKKDVDKLADSGESILIFGFNEIKNDYKEAKEDNSNTTTTYKLNGKECSKEEYEKTLNKLDEKYLDNVQDMLLDCLDFVSEMNHWKRLFGW